MPLNFLNKIDLLDPFFCSGARRFQEGSPSCSLTSAKN